MIAPSNNKAFDEINETDGTDIKRPAERRNNMKKLLNLGMCMYMMRMLYSRASQSVRCMT